ncbi:MAG TPA: glutamate formimidoyltransferase [Blastocatellia bacterium]|jgi:glutamate formiminotransferase|nr:glutamate formimidoyltransferase [Blastocatellia bacterium]
MKKIVECIPNFSEGHDSEKVELIVKTIGAVPRVVVLDYSMDTDHNRAVITFAGEPGAVLEAAVRAAAVAVELINLNTHNGEHPRLGALDVLPFVPIKGVTMEECVEIARMAGERIAKELNIPVYLYEKAATRRDRADLADIRRGEFEALRHSIESDPNRKPDFGFRRVHPTAGAMAVGARSPLVAFNVNLATDDLSVAGKVAKAVRASDGGLFNVKALGMELKSRNQTQVSMNLTDYEETPIFRAFEMVRREAARYGTAVVGSEIVGLIPQAALNACSEFYLQIENFSADLILERRLQSELSKIEPDFEYEGDIAPPQAVLSTGAAVAAGTKAEVNAASDIDESVEDQVMTNAARANAGIDGCGAAAIAGSLAAALGKLVCNLMIEQKKSSGGEARGVLDQLDQLTADLREASAEESKGRKQMAEALALPRDTDAERLARGMALEQATKNAVSAPLRIARTSMEVIELLNELTEIGNPTAVADVATGAQLAMTAMRGAGYVLLSDLMSVSDEDFNRRQRAEITELITRGRERSDEIEGLFFTLYPRD